MSACPYMNCQSFDACPGRSIVVHLSASLTVHVYLRSLLVLFLYHTPHACSASALQYYPNLWETTEYLSEEQSRLILPLAWLVRADQLIERRYRKAVASARGDGSSDADADEENGDLLPLSSREQWCAVLRLCPAAAPSQHVGWLYSFSRDYTARQTAYGGIQESLGNQTNADCPAPRDNADYGNGEAPLTQGDTDTVTDQLYSNNFALLSLWEAYGATRNVTAFGAPAAALAAYLTSIQAYSSAHPELSGGWPRAFDFAQWDFWGSSADWGWVRDPKRQCKALVFSQFCRAFPLCLHYPLPLDIASSSSPYNQGRRHYAHFTSLFIYQ